MAFYIAHGKMKWRKTKGESDMGWILGITAAVGILLAGIAGLACSDRSKKRNSERCMAVRGWSSRAAAGI